MTTKRKSGRPASGPQGVKRVRSSAVVRMRRAIEWALGTRGEFKSRSAGLGPYWWRMELAERAGLKWDGKKWVEHPND